MLIVELESSGDLQLDLEFLSTKLFETQQSREGDKVALFAFGVDVEQFEVRAFAEISGVSDIAYTSRAMPDDAEAFLASVYAFLNDTKTFQRLVVSNNLDTTLNEVSSSDCPIVSILERARGAVEEGDPFTGASFLNLARRLLKSNGNVAALAVEAELKALQVLMEIDTRFLRPESGTEARRLVDRGFRDDIAEFVGLHADTLNQYWRANPRLQSALNYHRDFIEAGQQYLLRMQNQADRSLRVEALLWLTVYFLRLSFSYERIKDSAASLCSAVRALECYLALVLIYEEMGYLDDRGFRLRGAGAMQGIGTIWSTFIKELAFDLRVSRPQIVEDVERTIRLRNRSALAHGTQRAGLAETRNFAQAVRTLVRASEVSRFEGPEQFEELWVRSEPLVAMNSFKAFIQRGLESSFFKGP